MELLDIKEVSFEEVLKQYNNDHGDTDDWEIRNLERANEKFKKWIFAKIPITEIGLIVLPHHIFDTDGEYAVIPEEGLTLEEVYQRFKENQEEHKRHAPECYAKIMFHKKNNIEKGMGSIFLSEEPLFVVPSYSKLIRFKNQLTHLDGSHRLMALMDSEEKPESIECYIAVNQIS